MSDYNPYFNPATKDIDDPEYTQTKQEWEDLQMSLEVVEDTLVALSPEEKNLLMERVNLLNREAVENSISELISRHPMEFEQILYSERVRRNIPVESNILDLLK